MRLRDLIEGQPWEGDGDEWKQKDKGKPLGFIYEGQAYCVGCWMASEAVETEPYDPDDAQPLFLGDTLTMHGDGEYIQCAECGERL